MSEISKQALKVDNNQSFPNNNTGYITPARLRDFNTNMIDSLVDEISYNADSASWNSSIDALQNFSSSLDTNFASQAEFNSYTQSNNAKVNSLINATASYATSAITASSLITASFDNGTRNLTFTKGDATTFAVNIPDVSGSSGNFVTTSSFNAFTQSADARLDSLEAATSSYAISSSVAAVDSAQQAQINSLIAFTGSVTASVNTGSFLITASVSVDDITFTKGDGSQFTLQIATGSSAVSASYAETSSIARNVVITARNGNASTLPIGTVVHITSAVGDNPIFNTASYNNELLSSNTLGILRQAATSGADVEVVVQGTVTGVNTDPVLGYAAGDILYLSSSGQFTKVQPQAPNQIVTLGQVLRAQQNNGSIYVSINNGWELNELHNVQITSPQTNELLAYESASYGLWKNKSISTLGLATTGSNTFKGNQYISGTIDISGSQFSYGSYNHTGDSYINGNVYVSGSVNLLNDGPNGWAFSSKALFLTNSVQTGFTVQSPIHFYKITKGDMYITANAGDPTSTGSMTIAVHNGQNLNISSSTIFVQGNQNLVGKQTIQGTGSTALEVISGNTILNGNLVANKVSCYDFDSIYYGSQMGGTTSNGTFFGYGSTDYTATFGAYGSGFDNELQTYVSNAGIEFRDFNGASYPSFLKLLPNTGANPAPIFTRGLQITGSVGIKGNSTLNGTFTANIPTASAESQNNLFNWAPFLSNNGTTYTLAATSLQDYGSSGIDQNFVIEYASADYDKYLGFLIGPTTSGQRAGFTLNNGYDYNFDEITLTDNGSSTTAVLKADKVDVQSVLQLKQWNPLPTGAVGQLAVSGSNLFYHNGSTWSQIN